MKVFDVGRVIFFLCCLGVPVSSAGFFGARVAGSSRQPAAPSSQEESSQKTSGRYAQGHQHEGNTQDRKSFGFVRIPAPEKPSQGSQRSLPKQEPNSRFSVNEPARKISSTIYRTHSSNARQSATNTPSAPRSAENNRQAPEVTIRPVVIKEEPVESFTIHPDTTVEPIDFTTTVRPVESVKSSSSNERSENYQPLRTPQADSNVDESQSQQFSKPVRASPPVRTRTVKPILNSQSRGAANVNAQEARSQTYRSEPQVTERPTPRQPSFNFRGRSTPPQNSESRYAPEESRHRNTNTYSAPRRPVEAPRRQEYNQQPQDHKEENFQYVPRGNVQIFSPSQNPTRENEKPKLRELNVDTSRKPLSQDFLPSCPDAKYSYIIPSPTQCDLYYVCDYGTPSKELCEDGMVFSIDEVRCVTPDIVDCKDRPLLQTPKGTGPCQRRNGVFFSDESCTEFITCRDNRPNYEKCAEGLVFDPKQKICAWADEALRPGCLPDDLLGFTCPNPKLTQQEANDKKVQLRFGDHDRFPDPDDCRYFFMCLITGQPRRAGCGNKKVFDPSTGVCRSAKDVPECADYYANDDDTSVSVSRASKRQRVQDDISRQLQEERSNLLRLRIKRWILEAEEADPE